MKIALKLRFDLPCDTACVCCSMTPNRKGSAWRCGCQAAGKTVQKPVKGTSEQVRKKIIGEKKGWQTERLVVTTLAEKLCPLTCMAAMNWTSFSMVSSEAPLWTVIKTEFLKKYLQFWWSIWYNSSNISALTSGEDLCQKWDYKVLILSLNEKQTKLSTSTS